MSNSNRIGVGSRSYSSTICFGVSWVRHIGTRVLQVYHVDDVVSRQTT